MSSLNPRLSPAALFFKPSDVTGSELSDTIDLGPSTAIGSGPSTARLKTYSRLSNDTGSESATVRLETCLCRSKNELSSNEANEKDPGPQEGLAFGTQKKHGIVVLRRT